MLVESFININKCHGQTSAGTGRGGKFLCFRGGLGSACPGIFLLLFPSRLLGLLGKLYSIIRCRACGLSRGLPGTRVGQEVLLLFSSQYGYGKDIVGLVPENTALAFDVAVARVIKNK